MGSQPRINVSGERDKPDPILVTGATGYVGGRLIPVLLAAGYRVRAMGRSLEKMAGRSWANHPLVELAAGDVMDPASLARAAKGSRTAHHPGAGAVYTPYLRCLQSTTGEPGTAVKTL